MAEGHGFPSLTPSQPSFSQFLNLIILTLTWGKGTGEVLPLVLSTIALSGPSPSLDHGKGLCTGFSAPSTCTHWKAGHPEEGSGMLDPLRA